jgi:anti-sigma regulatory factor (Ser/Thr protein kinase)
MTATFQRSLTRDVSAYLAIAAEAEEFCTAQGLVKSVVFKVHLVLEELVLNWIDHATGSATGRLDLCLAIEPSRVVLMLEDDADPFDPHSHPVFDKAKPLEERAPRGMGIQLVRSMTTEMEYTRVGSRNRLRVAVAR